MPRAILLVLDSVGCGAAADADAYGDRGADTLGHIARACADGEADRPGLRSGSLRLPNLCALGLGSACELSTGRRSPGLSPAGAEASWGYAVERSAGKDTPSGHWELAGTPVPFAWGYFPRSRPCFPPPVIEALLAESGVPGILGDCHASGTEILASLGAEHLRTGKPICYTSIDSVFQIAAHEEAFGLDRLYDLCRSARRLLDPLNIGRVIARPFLGTTSDTFRRTPNRKDFAILPPKGNLLSRAVAAQRDVVTVGKIGDIFAHQDTGRERKGPSNDANLDLLVAALDTTSEGGLIVANLVDFDTEHGHRRDVAGYAACLEAFDRRLPGLLAELRADDLFIITADHGNDPTFRGTDHTREHVPVLARCRAAGPAPIGRRSSFCDVGATAAAWLGLGPLPHGHAWLSPPDP